MGGQLPDRRRGRPAARSFALTSGPGASSEPWAPAQSTATNAERRRARATAAERQELRDATAARRSDPAAPHLPNLQLLAGVQRLRIDVGIEALQALRRHVELLRDRSEGVALFDRVRPRVLRPGLVGILGGDLGFRVLRDGVVASGVGGDDRRGSRRRPRSTRAGPECGCPRRSGGNPVPVRSFPPRSRWYARLSRFAGSRRCPESGLAGDQARPPERRVAARHDGATISPSDEPDQQPDRGAEQPPNGSRTAPTGSTPTPRARADRPRPRRAPPRSRPPSRPRSRATRRSRDDDGPALGRRLDGDVGEQVGAGDVAAEQTRRLGGHLLALARAGQNARGAPRRRPGSRSRPRPRRSRGRPADRRFPSRIRESVRAARGTGSCASSGRPSPHISSGASTPSRSSSVAITSRVAAQTVSRAGSRSGPAPTTLASR